MKHFRKVWTPELHEWLHAHKDMNRREAYRLFLSEFPELSDVTECAFINERSRTGAVNFHCTHGSTKARPLYAEQVKKGYVRIKVAQPNVWVSKAKWVYMETHPWEDFTERSNYIFLDGDTRNFSPGNIERVPLRIMGQFNLMGGTVKGNPEATRLRVLLSKLKMAEFDAGEKAGLVATYSSRGRKNNGRVFIEERNRKEKEYVRRKWEEASEEEKERIRQRRRDYIERVKRENPAEWAARKERRRAYMRERARRKRNGEGKTEKAD